MRIFQMQRISAVALLVFMTIHMTVAHYDIQANFRAYEITYHTVIDRLGTPLWKGIDIAFLFFVLLHALTGSYMVITDLERGYKYKKVFAWAAVMLGVIAFYFGAVTILSFNPTLLVLGS